MKTPADKIISFLYVSHPLENLAWRWQARLTFPAGAGPETRLRLDVTDGHGEPVAKGTLELAGQRHAISEGRGELTYAAFIAGKHKTAVWLHRPDLEPIPGGLTFG